MTQDTILNIINQLFYPDHLKETIITIEPGAKQPESIQLVFATNFNPHIGLVGTILSDVDKAIIQDGYGDLVEAEFSLGSTEYPNDADIYIAWTFEFQIDS